MSILAAALDYRRRGLSVIPLGPDKKPALRWKRYQTAAADEAKIRHWYSKPKPGVAVIFGGISGGLASRDFDDMVSYERWALDYPHIAEMLPTVETRRGRHVYGIVDPACELAFRKSIGKAHGTGAVACQGGELRIGVGCYSVLPPSIHPSGHVYQWLTTFDYFPKIDLFNAGFGPCNREVHRELKTGEGEQAGGDGFDGLDDLDNDGDLATTCDSDHAPHPSSCLEYSLDSLPSLLHEQVELAIQRTVPTKDGRRHRQVFELCRELQALPEFRGQSPKALKPLVREWHRRARPNIKTQAFEETYLDFIEGWSKVRNPKGEEPLTMMFAKVAAMEPPPEALQFDTPELRLLIGLCRELQIVARTEPFFLATRAAGALLQTSHVQVSRWLRLLCIEGVLHEVSKGSVETGQASRYRYLGKL